MQGKMVPELMAKHLMLTEAIAELEERSRLAPEKDLTSRYIAILGIFGQVILAHFEHDAQFAVDRESMTLFSEVHAELKKTLGTEASIDEALITLFTFLSPGMQGETKEVALKIQDIAGKYFRDKEDLEAKLAQPINHYLFSIVKESCFFQHFIHDKISDKGKLEQLLAHNPLDYQNKTGFSFIKIILLIKNNEHRVLLKLINASNDLIEGEKPEYYSEKTFTYLRMLEKLGHGYLIYEPTYQNFYFQYWFTHKESSILDDFEQLFQLTDDEEFRTGSLQFALHHFSRVHQNSFFPHNHWTEMENHQEELASLMQDRSKTVENLLLRDRDREVRGFSDKEKSLYYAMAFVVLVDCLNDKESQYDLATI